jgi:hypothetical protein
MEYRDYVEPALFAVKVMQRFFDEIVAERKEEIPMDLYHALYADAFDLVNEELAPYALDLALALAETKSHDEDDPPPGERRRSRPSVAR